MIHFINRYKMKASSRQPLQACTIWPLLLGVLCLIFTGCGGAMDNPTRLSSWARITMPSGYEDHAAFSEFERRVAAVELHKLKPSDVTEHGLKLVILGERTGYNPRTQDTYPAGQTIFELDFFSSINHTFEYNAAVRVIEEESLGVIPSYVVSAPERLRWYTGRVEHFNHVPSLYRDRNFMRTFELVPIQTVRVSVWIKPLTATSPEIEKWENPAKLAEENVLLYYSVQGPQDIPYGCETHWMLIKKWILLEGKFDATFDPTPVTPIAPPSTGNAHETKE